MKIRPLDGWPRHFGVQTKGRTENWRGPRRALTVEEQMEVQRLMRAAAVGRRRWSTSRDLATRYGVSKRTIWRYVATIPVPEGMEFLRMRLRDWQTERGIHLTTDDMVTLLNVIARHRDRRHE